MFYANSVCVPHNAERRRTHLLLRACPLKAMASSTVIMRRRG